MSTNIHQTIGQITTALVTLFALATVPANLGAATITVTNSADNGVGTLRGALASAANDDTINFSITGTILLTSGELIVSRNVSILGPGANNLAVDGNASSRVFHITSNTVAAISGLTVTNGHTIGIAPLLDGGGIYNEHATLTISNCTLTGNSAGVGSGGAIFNDGNFGQASLLIVDSTLSGNSGLSGGGVLNVSEEGGTASLVIVNSTLTKNSAGAISGAIHNGCCCLATASVEIVNTTLSGNSAGDGGAGAIENFGGFLGNAVLEIVNSTLSGNTDTAGNYAGGIKNEADDNGMVSLMIGSTILIAGDSGPNIYSPFGRPVTSLGYNLSSDNGGGFLTNITDQVNTDPMLGPLQDNGGSTFTHIPLCGSPAIDRGKNFSASLSDQRGDRFARTFDDPASANSPGGDGTDIGAVELQRSCIKTPAEQTSDLVALVQDMSIQVGVKNALLAKLQAALAAISSNNNQAACGTLHAFINQINAQSGKKVTLEDAASLIDEATRIRAALGC